MNIITRHNIDVDKVERLKPIYYGGRSLRVYFFDSYVEYDDADGSLYDTLKAALARPERVPQ